MLAPSPKPRYHVAGGFSLEAKLKFIPLAAAASLVFAVQAKADCKSDIEAIMQAHLKAGPYHTSMDMVANGKTRKVETDVILPSSFHVKMPEMETIMLKQGTWMKMGSTWKAMPAAMSAMTGNMMQDAMAQGLKNASNFKCGSTADFDGQSYPVYEFDTSGEAMGIKATSHIQMFKGPNNLPVGMIVAGEAMGVKSVTTQHIKYDPAITINPPQ
jgi:hypothetical protein